MEFGIYWSFNSIKVWLHWSLIVLKFWFHWSFDCIEVLIPLKFRLICIGVLIILNYWFHWSFDLIGVLISSEFQLHRSFNCIEVLISSMFWLHWFFDFVAVLIALEFWVGDVKPKANTLMTTFRCCLYLIGHRPLIFQSYAFDSFEISKFNTTQRLMHL